ncbi:hypothetical protein [Streptomyces malaysiensis]|uniref:hypothetical protein n=1 Tax=Streptomyces malaysiensis TaxID=92644 RepID=UPI000ABEC886
MTALVSARGLLPTAMTPATTTAEGEGAQSGKRRSAPGRIRVLAALAATVILSEGAANGWSAVHLKDILGGPAGTGAVGYGAYAAATAGPLTLLCAGAAAAAGLLRTASGHTREAARGSH